MKKGFTLIELLAVVIVLAVIALIATPIVLDVINDARNSTNLSSANMVLSAAKNYYAESWLDNSKKDKMDGKTNLFYDLQLENKPKEGTVYINEEGNVALVLILNNKCYVKAYNTEIEEYSKDAVECDLESAIDETKPTVALELIGGEIGNDNWYKTSPYIKVTVTDDVSGFNSYKWCVGLDCTPNNIEYENGSSKTLTDSAATQFCAVGVDKAGNESDKTCIDEIKVDTISPEISGIADITVNVNETVDLNTGVEVSDNLSGVEGTFVTEPESVDTKTTGTKEVKYTVLDKAGNKTEITRKVIVSASAPTITFEVADGIINENGWAKSNFFVTINVTDNTGHGLKEFKVCTSPTDTCDPTNGSVITNSTTATREIITEGNNNRICVQATDKTDQTSEIICSDAYKLDKTIPTVSYSVLGGTYNEYKTIRITPSDDNYDYMFVHVYKDGAGPEDYVPSKSSSSIKDLYFDVSLDSDGIWYVFTQVYDKAGNIQIQEPISIADFYYQKYIIDTTEPTLELSKETYFEDDFSSWSLNNSEIDSEGNLVLAPTGTWGGAASQYYQVNGEKWYVKFDGFTTSASPKHDSDYGDSGPGEGAIYIRSQYFDSNFEFVTAQNGSSENGYAPNLPLNVWSNNFKWNGYNGYGDDVQHLTIFFSTGGEWSQPITKIRNFKLYGQLYNDFYIINLSNKSEDIKIIKYALGEQTKDYFENNGTEVTTDVVRVTENGTYTFYIEDNAGNKTTKTIVIDKIEKTSPIITAKSATNKIKLGDSNEIKSYFNINQNGEASITQTTCINKTDNSTITNTSSLTAGTHTIECKVLKANNKTATATTNISVLDYGTTTSSSYDALYIGTTSGTLKKSDLLYSDGNYSFGNLIGFDKEIISIKNPHYGPTGSDYENTLFVQDYINIGTNYYSLSQKSNLNNWLSVVIQGGWSTSQVQIGNIKLRFDDGNEFTLKESVDNGYIEPLVVIDSYSDKEYLFKDSFNLYNGGQTAISNYPLVIIYFKTTSKSELVGFNMYSSVNFCRAYEDGFVVWQYLEDFEISTKPW